MPAPLDGDDPTPMRPLPPGSAGDPNQFIEQLPRAMDAPPQFALVPRGDGHPWQVTITLAPRDQAALEALQPSAYQLCAAAQHALGLAAIGSQIDPARWTVAVRAAGGPPLGLAGAPALWWTANAPPPLLRAFLDRLAAQVARNDVQDTPVSAALTTKHGSRAGDG